jgi:acyl-coenzyme A thioesterase PaaI-like protein
VTRTFCVGCRPTESCRLGITAIERVGRDGVRAWATVPGGFEGTAGVAHGGWIAAVLVEVLGQLPSMHGHPAATRDLAVRYLQPVPMDSALSVRGRVLTRVDRRWTMTASIGVSPATAALATASGTWVEHRRR